MAERPHIVQAVIIAIAPFTCSVIMPPLNYQRIKWRCYILITDPAAMGVCLKP